LRQKQVTGFWIILAGLMIVGVFAGYMLPFASASRSGMSYWITLTLVVVATMVGLPAVFFVALVDNQAKAQPADVFERHFGFGLDRLVESWREWVQEQGIGTFAPLPPRIEEGLLDRLVPLIEDREANREDRILAIRRMGSQGYFMGADALIGLLRNVDAIPREVINSALWWKDRAPGLAALAPAGTAPRRELWPSAQEPPT
jgi:hypothetical protein